jgi:hypothetical protein
MPLEAKVEQNDLILYEILRNPVLCTEFVYNAEKLDYEQPFIYTWYQAEFLCDFNPYVSVSCARAVGKSEALVGMMLWLLLNNVFPIDYIVYTVPSKVHLEPIWSKLIRQFKSNSFLKHFLGAGGSGVNGSDFSVRLLNNSQLLCRIAGQSGTGANVIGLHSPFVLLDECVVGTQRIACKNSNKYISDIKSGDIVLSWNGDTVEEDRVISTRKIENKQSILEIGYDNKYIRVGEHHKIYTDFGYVEANTLSVGDSIYLFENTNRKQFNDDEINFIKEQIKLSIPVYEIAKQLNRTEPSIFRKIDHLGLSVREIYDSESLSNEEYQIILGSLLGDGCAEFELTRARYRTNHSLKQKEYVDWIADKLKRLIRTRPKISKNGGWGTYNYTLGTLGHPQILDVAKELYINNKKTITREYLNKLSPLGLAVWFMDDGSKSGMLSTHSFSENENKIIVEYLKEKWNIDSKIYCDKDKNLYFINIKHSSLSILKNIIKDYIPECMQYKIGNGIYNNEIPTIELIEKQEKPETLIKQKISYIKKINSRAKYLYNIEVEKNHNYFVNGVLTKNSGYYPFSTWTELQPTLNTFTNGYRLITSGVPTGLRERNVNYQCDQENSNYSKHNISALQNPRFSDDDHQRAIEQYGGTDTDDYIHLVLGQHGKPVFALFDRNQMEISSYPVWKMVLDGTKFYDNLNEYLKALAIFPSLPDKDSQCIFGVDLGYTEPTAIVIMYLDRMGRLKFHGRIRLNKVNYFVQEKIIDWLDSKFSPLVIGIDEGSSGKAVIPRLQEHEEFSHKDYKKRVIPINFSTWTVLGMDADGNEIKSKTKPFAVGVLQDYSNNHKIVYSSQDLELITELERMTYSKNPNGDITYRTLTERGGKRGEDHFSQALLCGVLAYYLANETLNFQRIKKKLARSFWNLNR